MRHRRAAVLVAAILTAYGAFSSFVTARELAELAPRARPEITAVGAALNVVGVLLAVALFGGLGRVVRRSGGARRDAIRAGILAGAFAGLTTGIFRSLALRDYLAAVVSGYGVDVILVDVVLVIGVVFASLAGAALGAVLAWLGFSVSS